MAKCRYLGAAGVIALTAAGPGFAQDAASQVAPPANPVAESRVDPSSAAQSEGLNEIVVTAQKRSENLQKVPISVSVVSSEQLVSRGVDNTIELANVVPGLAILNVGGVITPRLRGVGSTSTSTGNESPVAV